MFSVLLHQFKIQNQCIGWTQTASCESLVPVSEQTVFFSRAAAASGGNSPPGTARTPSEGVKGQEEDSAPTLHREAWGEVHMGSLFNVCAPE